MKFIDLFAGIGGMRIPFENLGGECVFTSEIDKFARETYQANFKGEVAGDITKIKAEEIPGHDLLLAGFPCQSFSQAGLKHGFADTTRGTMFFEIARILKHHKPKAFLLENVKGLRNHNKGRTLKTMLNILSNIGYETHYKVLNARDFGQPQNRERVFLVGFCKEDEVAYSFPVPPKIPVRLGDIMEQQVSDEFTLSDMLWQGHQDRKAKARAKGYGFGYSLFNEDSRYTSAMTARYYKDGSEILLQQEGSNPRRLTPREAARLQGFPDSFVIPVSKTQAYKQFGNSVAVPVILALAEKIVDKL